MMSDLTYIKYQDGSQRQTAVVASRGSENTPVFEGSAPRSRLLASAVAAWGNARDASFEADAHDWGALSRITIVDGDSTWRIVYRADPDAVIIAEVFKKKTSQTPKRVIATCKARLREYDDG